MARILPILDPAAIPLALEALRRGEPVAVAHRDRLWTGRRRHQSGRDRPHLRGQGTPALQPADLACVRSRHGQDACHVLAARGKTCRGLLARRADAGAAAQGQRPDPPAGHRRVVDRSGPDAGGLCARPDRSLRRSPGGAERQPVWPRQPDIGASCRGGISATGSVLSWMAGAAGSASNRPLLRSKTIACGCCVPAASRRRP